MGPRHRRTRTAAFLALALFAACGTRLPDEAFVEARVVDGQQVVEGSEQASGSTTTVPDGADPRAGDDPASSGSESPDGDTGGPGTTTPGQPGQPGAPQASGPNQASDVGVTETTLKLGTIVAENGVLGDAFAPTARGIRAWAAQTNADGGIHGRKVELVTCDDREDRSRALDCARRLVEQDKVFAIVATNTRALGGASPYLAESKVPVFGVPITNGFYRWSNFFSAYGAPYNRDGNEVGHKDQLRSLSGGYRWFKENLKVSKAAVVAYDIAESAQAGEFIAKGLELEGFQVDQYTVSFAAPSFDQVVADMERKGTEIVFDAMDDGANRRFCDTLSRRGYKVKGKVTTIVGMGQSVGQDFNEVCRNVMFVGGSSVAYTQTEVPVIAEFRAAFDKYQPGVELHQWAVEAYLLGKMFAAGVEELGPAPTRKALIDKFNGRSEQVVVEGALISGGYQPVDFSAPRAEQCFSVARWQDDKGGWVQATQKFPHCVPDAHQFFTPVRERGD